ncbi:hypothetical protein NQ315_009615 [Exocentrus adspersus]|uniref:SAGA-associated factor 11 n=1 Tax=Exocentrus adspersus TaxID=1586481 RepID=A0AAV8WHH5_9CUCU|nr:hypothetical protein NQ315_009615 [Exocentrus adspersus]
MSKRQKPEHKQLFGSLAKDLHELVSNKQALRMSVENFLNSLIDEMTLGIIFDLHRKYKTNAYDLEVDDSCDDDDSGDMDAFSQPNLKKIQDCNCPNCGRAMATIRFSSHLETCMGMGGRNSRSRNASRRAASNSNDRDSSYSGIPSDDDDDADWNSGDRRKKKKEKNGGKKNRGTPKKIFEPDLVEPVNIDVEGDDDELTNLRDILHLQDHSNSTSPTDSASSSGSIKKKDKSKSKKSGKRDRTSPSLNISLE